MKKGKKGWLLLMAFTTWAVLIAGCGKWPGNKQDKVPEVTMAGRDTENIENPENSQSTPLPDIQELTYYVHGTMMEPIRSVSQIRQGEKALVRIEFWRSFVCIEQITQGTCFTCVLLGYTFDENKTKKCRVYCECQ